MATTFLEPGGDATFIVDSTTAGGFWQSVTGPPTIATDFVHGGHIKSIKSALGAQYVVPPNGSIADSGSRFSFYMYIETLPSVAMYYCSAINSVPSFFLFRLQLGTGGVLKIVDGANAQIGTDGATLLAGQWYRISLAYTITDTTNNRFELFVDGNSSISITNATLTHVGTSTIRLGHNGVDTDASFRFSDIYIDDSSSLVDMGDVWVTAKRPNANGTANNFSTQIGAGGSGYGTGHSPQVNERALSTTNGWSMVGAGAAVTEEYKIENASTGDININGFTIVDYIGWAYMSALVGETVQMIVNGVNFAQAITSTNTMYTKVAGSTTYPAGTGADIGVTTDTSLTTVSLFEAGVMVAYISPPPAPPQWNVVIS